MLYVRTLILYSMSALSWDGGMVGWWDGGMGGFMLSNLPRRGDGLIINM